MNAWITEPGQYDLDEAAYHRDPVIGGSLSSTGARSLLPPSTPARFRYEQLHGRPDSVAFDLGRAAHTVALGAGAPIAPLPFKDRRAAGWKAAAAEARALGETPLPEPEAAQVHMMVQALRQHPIAGPLLARPGKAEQSFIARDPESGVMCRARVDWMPDVADDARLLVVDYKGLALDTAIPTVDGWSTMRALQVGDQVFGSDGKACTVTAKSEVHYRTCYRLRFDDGSSVICDDEHLWATVTTSSANRVGATAEVRTTDEIRRTLRKYGQRQHRIPLAAPLQLPELPLPIDPYVLGTWIGDGAASCGRVTSGDEETWELLRARGYAVGEPPPSEPYSRTVFGLMKQLRQAGYLGHKAIPSLYLRASVEQRTDLLRGLMDTDGSWNATRHQAVFTTVSKALAEQVRELALSLGQRAVAVESTATGFGKTVIVYRVNFTPLGGLVPFALTRKAAGVGSYPRARSKQRVVVDVEDVLTVPTQCITVDSPDSTYLCTEAMIPTHNTTKCAEPAAFARSMADYGYHQQGPFYCDVLSWLGLDHGLDPRFVLIAQEKTPPYLVTVASPSAEAIEWGRVLNRKARDIYRTCMETGEWPGYPAVPAELNLPGWLLALYENAHAAGLYDTASDLIGDAAA